MAEGAVNTGNVEGAWGGMGGCGGAWGGRGRPVTFQHAEVHGVVGSLGHAEHHLQAVFNLPLPLLAAREQLLQGTETVN